MWVTKLLISPVNACRLIRCPVGGLVGGCGAWAVSRKTPITLFYAVIDDYMTQNIQCLNHKLYERVWYVNAIV